jgi:hypothetical protein
MFTTVGSATDQHLHPDFDCLRDFSHGCRYRGEVPFRNSFGFLKAGFGRSFFSSCLLYVITNSVARNTLANSDGRETQSLARDRFSDMGIRGKFLDIVLFCFVT